jgi:hypothetical protein
LSPSGSAATSKALTIRDRSAVAVNPESQDGARSSQLADEVIA